MTRVAVIFHVAFEDLGSFAGVLAERGLETRFFEAAADDLSAAETADLLIVLGGPIGVNDREDYPFLQTEIDLLKRRLAADRPTLGLCLGAQLMAAALGARVYPGPAKEIGWAPLSLTGAAEALLGGFKDLPVLHWHGDRFDLPDGAVRLASTKTTPNQGFTMGKRVLALQFHPEVTPQGLERWFVGHTGEIGSTDGIDVPSLRADTRRFGPPMIEAGTKFFGDWLDRVLG